MDPARYDNVVLLGSDRMDSSETTDARTVLGYVLLRSLLAGAKRRPQILVELMDAENAGLFQRRMGEVIISPLLLAHLLAHVSLRRELNAVFGELFGPGGAECSFRTAASCELAGRPLPFRKIQRAAAARGEIALGLRLCRDRNEPDGGLHLAPPLDATFTLDERDEVVVLGTPR